MILVFVSLFALLAFGAGLIAALYFLTGFSCVVGAIAMLVMLGFAAIWFEDAMDRFARSGRC